MFISAIRNIVRDREIIVRDGDTAKIVRIPALMQFAVIAILLCLTAWSGYAAARLATAHSAVLSYQAHERAEHARLAERQEVLAALGAQLLEERYQAKLAELEEMGVDMPAMGGPFEETDKGDENFRELFNNWKKLDSLHSGAIAVPSDKPVKSATLTSAYGTRTDPFKGSRARHGGIDLAGPVGTPIYVTADGVVLRAGWNNGGYGNLVEVDHGNGIITRYAHMSKITVKAGERVKRGQKVGQMGSTGRSTGSHLHYEVRIDGKAVNPIPFMRSADYLVALNDKAEGSEEVGLGGGGR